MLRGHGSHMRSFRESLMPLPKPKAGESQSSFMSRCMSEAFGSDAPEDRTQEQATAMCLDAFRRKDKAADEVARVIARWHAKYPGIVDKMDIEPGENEDDFVERCIADSVDDGMPMGEAGDFCQTMGHSGRPLRAASDVQHRTHAETPRKVGAGWHFVLSDETEDRLGDIITADGWEVEAFKRNPVALFSHDPQFIIGKWHDVQVKSGQLRGRLELAPEGTSPRIDEIRRLVEADILKAVSVGFRGRKREPLTEKSDPFFGPFRYLRQELVECSLVAVPANPNSLQVAKSLRISADTLDLVFAGQGKKDGIIRRAGVTGGHAETPRHNRKGSKIMSTLSERIATLQSEVTTKRDALEAHLEKMDND